MKNVRQMLCCLCAVQLAACGGGGGSSSPPAPSVTVTVTPPAASVMVGQQIQLAATTKDATGNALTTPVTWASSNPAIATVNTTGLVVALTLGQAMITATSQGQSGAAAVTTTTGINFVNVSAGDKHTCGETPQGVVYCWGDNSSGQLGNGTTTNSPIPVPVAGGIIFGGPLSAGGKHTCATTNVNNQTGPLYCWGDNSSGQLGNGTTTNSTVPVAVLGGLVFDDVTAGSSHACTRTVNTGGGYCWGNNSSGQLGNGTTTNSSVPVAISGGPVWYGLSAGSDHSCGLGVLAVGNPPPPASCWGNNSAGQLGNGTTIGSALPVDVSGSTGVTITFAGTHYSCGIADDGTTYCWGDNSSGQLGNGSTTSTANPVGVMGKFSAVSTGVLHACGVSILSGGLNFPPTYCWGDNSQGQLGNGTTSNSAIPIVVAGGLEFASVSAGGHHTCGVAYAPGATVGAAYCWGDNTFGQLGNSWTTSSSVPVNVTGAQ